MSQEEQRGQTKRSRRKGRLRSITDDVVGVTQQGAKRVVGATKEAATSMGEPISDTIITVREAVMVRLDKDSLDSIDVLVDCGHSKSRSKAAAFLISEGIKAKADLYGKIAAQADVIRKARQELQSLLDEEGGELNVESDR